MDMTMIFEISFNHTHKIFKEVVLIGSLMTCSFQSVEWSIARMNNVAMMFLHASNGVINGCIGAIDEWVVKIKKSSRMDNAINAQSFYSQKEYLAVNVQTIDDKEGISFGCGASKINGCAIIFDFKRYYFLTICNKTIILFACGRQMK